jgi:hypothetical protein
MISNDAAYVPALLAPHPDGRAPTTRMGRCRGDRRKLMDRVIADKMMVCGRISVPGAGARQDGAGYAFIPAGA